AGGPGPVPVSAKPAPPLRLHGAATVWVAGKPRCLRHPREVGPQPRGGSRPPPPPPRTTPEGAHPGIVRRMPLRAGKQSRVCRDEGSRPGTGGGYDMGSHPRPIISVEAEASILPHDASHVHETLDGDPVAMSIVDKELHDIA